MKYQKHAYVKVVGSHLIDGSTVAGGRKHLGQVGRIIEVDPGEPDEPNYDYRVLFKDSTTEVYLERDLEPIELDPFERELLSGLLVVGQKNVIYQLHERNINAILGLHKEHS